LNALVGVLFNGMGLPSLMLCFLMHLWRFLFIDLGCTGARTVLEYHQIVSNAQLDVFELMTKLAFWTASYGTIDLIIFFVFGIDKAKPTTGLSNGCLHCKWYELLHAGLCKHFASTFVSVRLPLSRSEEAKNRM